MEGLDHMHAVLLAAVHHIPAVLGHTNDAAATTDDLPVSIDDPPQRGCSYSPRGHLESFTSRP